MHGNPALRLLIVIAYCLAAAIITNEAKIVTYAAQGFIQTIFRESRYDKVPRVTCP
jgi:hypothetical protein